MLAGMCGTSPAIAAAASNRPVTELRDGWRFKQDNDLVGAESAAFDDHEWVPVSVPHSWNRVGAYMASVATRINTPDKINKVQGVGWYRRSLPAVMLSGRRAWLEFDAASRVAKVWLNGVYLGEHRGGYSRFRFDATAALRTNGSNELAVRVDNTAPAIGSATKDVLPLAGDFFVPGGLYRPVRLILTNSVHLEMLDAGGSGAFLTTRSIEKKQAILDAAIQVRNDSKRSATVRVRSALISAAGVVAAKAEQQLSVAANSTGQVRAKLQISAPRLWRGVDDPYLYRFVAEVTDAAGGRLDRLEQPFGIRQMRFDPKHGFFLNGKPYTLRGVGYHQDREDRGFAIEPADVEGDVKLLREMGVTSLRLTHYQHGEPIHDLADRYGLILWDEIPLVSAWTLGAGKEATPALRENARQQLTELIHQKQNHASVAVWGIANEVDFGNSLPTFISGVAGPPPDPLPLLAELKSVAKTLDPARPTVLATCCEGRLFTPGIDVPITAGTTDMSGANRYFGWYYGKSADLSANLDGLRARRPWQPLAVTEYGAGGSLSIHTDNVLGGPADPRGRGQPEEYESFVHEANWAILSSKPYLWATWLWSAFDFASTVRHEGDADDINTKGLVAFDHKTRKDAYYFYKANWSKEPTVWITARRYVDRAYAVTAVRVYSNAVRTDLVVNGRTVGSRTTCSQRICIWSNVSLSSGENRVSARGQFARGSARDSVTWRILPDVARSVRIDTGTMIAGSSRAGRFGSDNFFIGGAGGSVVKPADYGRPAQPVTIAGTSDSEIAATYRSGNFAYHVPLSDGTYRLTLTFIEPSARPSERLFDVIANDRVILERFDIAKEGGTAAAAINRQFTVSTRGGALDLNFRPIKGDAIVSAIQIERTIP